MKGSVTGGDEAKIKTRGETRASIRHNDHFATTRLSIRPRGQYALREGILARNNVGQSSSAKYTALHTPPSIHYGPLRTLSLPLPGPDQPCGPVSCPRSEPTNTANEAASAASFHVISPPAAHGSPCSRRWRSTEKTLMSHTCNIVAHPSEDTPLEGRPRRLPTV